MGKVLQGLDGQERHVQQTISAVLGVEVVQHDDGSVPSMYDLRIGREDAPVAAIEVSQDVDPKYRATVSGFDKHNGGHVSAPSLTRSWIVVLTPGTRMRKMNVNGVLHLAEIEKGGLDRVDVNVARERLAVHAARGEQKDAVTKAVDELVRAGVDSAHSYGPDPEGAYVHYSVVTGYTSESDLNLVVDWIEAFTANPRRADNLRKIDPASTGAAEAHLAVFCDVTGHGGAWRVLFDRDGQGALPNRAPVIPEPITHLWLFPTYDSATGLAWNCIDGWTRFARMYAPAAVA